jgi:hypothetical protein
MKEIQTEIQIHASAETIWKILMDFEQYPDWNPFIKSISGEKEVGSRLTAFIGSTGENGMTFQPKVLVYNPNYEFRWLGKLWGGLFFNGEHYFILKELGNHSTQFIHGEKFTGMLVGVLGKMLDNTKNGFEAMNRALKQRAEGK